MALKLFHDISKAPFEKAQKFEPIHLKICILQGVEILTTINIGIVGFSYMGSWRVRAKSIGTKHYNDVTMAATVSLITSLTIVYLTVYSSADQRKHQSSASLAFVQRIHRRPENFPHKWPVTRKMFPFYDVIMHSKKPLHWYLKSPTAWNCFEILFRITTENDDIIKWKHFPRYLPFVWEIQQSPVNSPDKGRWRRALMFPLICTWTNSGVNTRYAADLKRHRAHYEVNVMNHLSSALLTLCEQNPPCHDVILFLNIFPCIIQITTSFVVILRWMLRNYRFVKYFRPSYTHIHRDTWPQVAHRVAFAWLAKSHYLNHCRFNVNWSQSSAIFQSK